MVDLAATDSNGRAAPTVFDTSTGLTWQRTFGEAAVNILSPNEVNGSVFCADRGMPGRRWPSVSEVRSMFYGCGVFDGIAFTSTPLNLDMITSDKIDNNWVTVGHSPAGSVGPLSHTIPGDGEHLAFCVY